MDTATLDAPAVDWSSKGWRYRLIAATGGPKSPGGAFVLAVLDKAWRCPLPRYTGPCTIRPDGVVTAPFLDSRGVFKTRAVSTAEDMVAACKRYADLIKMTDAEATEWMGEVRKWITLDMRSPGEHGRPLDR